MQTLQQYLQATGTRQSAFAALIGATPATVSRWCAGRVTPSPDSIRLIDDATKGAVPPAVWFQHGAKPAPDEAA